MALDFSDAELECLLDCLRRSRANVTRRKSLSEPERREILHFLNNILGRLTNVKNIRVLRGEWRGA